MHYLNVDHASYEPNQIGSFECYFVQENNDDTMAVLAVTGDGMIPLVEQYRIVNHRQTLETLAGYANNLSKRPADVAKCELAEEIGFDAAKLTQLTRFMNMPSYSIQHIAVFFVIDLTLASRQGIGLETPRFDVCMVSVDDAYEMMVNGTAVDTKTMVTILYLKNGTFDYLSDRSPCSIITATVNHCNHHTIAT